MKTQASVWMAIILLLTAACAKEKTDPRTEHLTSGGWGKPAVIELMSGFTVYNNCPEGSYFRSDGSYSHQSSCPTFVALAGNWKWTDDGYLLISVDATGEQDKMQIMELSDSLMHVKWYVVKASEGRTYYAGELKYRHNPGAK